MDVPEPTAVRWVLLGGMIATAAFIAIELTAKGTPHVEAAVRVMTRGRYASQFWVGGIAIGLALPAIAMVIALVADTGPGLPTVAAVAAVVGMWFYEDSFVRAGQSVPLS